MMRIIGVESDEIAEVRVGFVMENVCEHSDFEDFTGNQCSCRAGVMWDCRLRPRVSRAAVHKIYYMHVMHIIYL